MANFKRNISALLKDELESNGVLLNLSKIKLPKQGQELHRPIMIYQLYWKILSSTMIIYTSAV